MRGKHFKFAVVFCFLLGLIAVTQGQSHATEYSRADYVAGSNLVEKVFWDTWTDEWGSDDAIYWLRGMGFETITPPATGNPITDVFRKSNAFGESFFYKSDAGASVFYKYEIDSPEDGQFSRHRYDFVSAPGDMQNPSVSDFDPSNLATPSYSVPATLDTATPYSQTFASIKYDLTGSEPSGYRVEDVVFSVDDNSGSFYNLTDPSNPLYDEDAVAAWSDNPATLQGLIKFTTATNLYYTSGKKQQKMVIDYRKNGIGTVAKVHVLTDLTTGEEIESSVQYLMKYNVTEASPSTAQVTRLKSVQVQVVDSNSIPVPGSFVYGIAYARDQYGLKIYDHMGRALEDYEVGAAFEDSPATGLYTLYFLDEGTPNLLDIFYAAPGYISHSAPEQDLVALNDASPPPTYTLTNQAIQVSFHVKDSLGNGIANAEVEVGQDYGPTGMESGGGAFGITDNSGYVTLDLAESATISDYTIKVWPPHGSPYLGGPWQGGGINETGFTDVNITNFWPGYMTGFADGDTVQLVLSAGITISGTISNNQGAGIADVQVAAQPEPDPITGEMTGGWSETTTGADGSYSLTVSAGSYKIEFQTTYWEYDTGNQITVAGGYIGGFADGTGGTINDWMQAFTFDVQESTTINATLPTGNTISGVIVNQSMQPIDTPMSINVHSDDFTKWYWTDVDTSNGSFTVTVEPGLNYSVEVWPGWDPLTGMEDTTYSGGSFIVHPDPYGDNGTTPNPLFEAGYNIEDMSTTPLIVAGNVTQTEIDTYHSLIDPGGLVAGLTAASLTDHISGMVMGVHDQHIVTSMTVDTSIKIVAQVEQGDEKHGRLVDDQGNGIANAWINAMVSGTSTDENGCFTLSMPTSAVVTGSVSSFQVDIWPGWNQTTGMQDNSFIGGVVTSGNGSDFSMTPMWDNAYQFDMDLTNWPVSTFTADACGVDITGLLVTSKAGVTISGTVTDGTDPIPNVWVNAWSNQTNFGSGAMTGNDGTYSIPVQGVENPEDPAIAYEVGIWEPNFINPAPQFISVTDSEVTGVDFTLGTGNAIKGRVVNVDNNGLAWMWVEVFSTDYSNWFGANTDKNGYYSASVPDGEYIVKVEGWDNTGQKVYQTKYYKNATSESAATRVTVEGANVRDINFKMSSGNTISGSITGLSQGDRVWLDAWSETTNSWAGKEVIGGGSGTDTFLLKGLASASDYRLNIWSDSYINGQYGGTPGEAASAPVDWQQSTLLSTVGGSISGVNIELSSGGSITLTVTGLQVGDTIDANVWSDSIMMGGWGYAEVTSGDSVVVTIPGINTTGTDYRLYIGDWQGNYKQGFYSGDLSETPGTIVNWDQATMIDMTGGDLSLALAMGTGGSISGEIENLPTGARVWIDAYSDSTGAWGGTEVIGDADEGSNDTYSIKGLDPATDFRVGLWGNEIPGGFYSGTTALTTWDKAAFVTVADSPYPNDIIMAITSGRTISGAVSGLQNGERAWLDAWSDETFAWSGTDIKSSGEASSNYTIRGLKPNTTAAGGYKVNLSSQGYMNQKHQGGLVDLSSDNATAIDFTLATGGSISGTITGLNSYKCAWVDASSSTANSWNGTNACADQAGNAAYTIEGLGSATDYVVSLSGKNAWYVYNETKPERSWDNHTDVPVSGSDETSGINFDLSSADATYTLSGTISGLSGSKVVDISAWSNSGGGSWVSRNGNGTYQLKGLFPGDYTIEIRADGYIDQRTGLGITVTSGAIDSPSLTWTNGWNNMGTVSISENTTGLDVPMSSGFSVSGTVTDGTDPVPYAWVNAWSADDSSGGGAMTDANGNYIIEGLPALTYTVETWTKSGSASISVSVTNADVPGQNLTISKEAGSIVGTVTIDGSPASGSFISVYHSDMTYAGSAVTGLDGTYSVDDLATGEIYIVEVYLPESDYSAPDSTTDPIDLIDGTPVTRDFTF